jgi:hypothetical protein
LAERLEDLGDFGEVFAGGVYVCEEFFDLRDYAALLDERSKEERHACSDRR